MNVLWAICLLLSACGSSQTAAPPTASSEADAGGAERSGMVYLRNETPHPIEVTYLNTDRDGGLRLVRSLVDRESRRAVSDAALPASLRIELDVVLEVPSDVGPRVRRKVPIQIRGDVDLRAYLVEAGDMFSLAVEIVPE